ncbi:MAG: glutathione S-transferase family protein [Caulobacteraceae bacterium]
MSVTPVRLYDFPFSGNGYKVRLALNQLGIAVDRQVVDILKGEAQSPSFLAKNPSGQIPALELSDGRILRESNAILFWLGLGTHLLSPDRETLTATVQWMCFEQSNIDKVLGRARFLRAYPDYAKVSAFDFATWHAAGHAALDVLEKELSDRRFLVGDRYSVADISLFGYVHTAAEGGFDLDRFPSVRAWLSRVTDQPGHISQ